MDCTTDLLTNKASAGSAQPVPVPSTPAPAATPLDQLKAWETDGQSVSTGDCDDLAKHMTGTGGWLKSEPQPAILPAEWVETIDVNKEFSQSAFDPARGMQSEPQPAILPAEWIES